MLVLRGKLRYFRNVIKKRKPSSKPTRSTRSSTARKWRTTSQRTQRGTRRGARQSNRFWLSRKNWGRLGSLCLTFAILGLLVLAWFASELPALDQLETYEKPPGIRVYDTSSNLIGSYGHVVGRYVPYDEIPKHLIDALLATEDRRFFEHSGVDPWGIARAMYHNILAGGVVQGGSTITQQLAKNTFLTPARTLKRKIQEVMLSLWMENHFSKEKILEVYLNRVYLGAGNYGIDAASHHYFDKSATELTLQESALLVGLLKAPSRYAPTRDKELSFKRTQQVILNMKDAELLNDRAASEAIGKFPETINLKVTGGPGSRYFADWVVDRIPQLIGNVSGDFEVYTTLDPRLQLTAEETLTRYMESEGKKKDASQAALLAMTPEGAIKAMVGGVDYAESQFNRTTQAKRQPGSSFKLFVYLAALEWGLTPNSWVEDKAVRYGGWSPRNYNGRYLGELRLREAFFRSINTVAVQLANLVGVDAVINMARRLGVESPLEPNLSISLGTSEITMLEMVGAYAHLANNGRRTQPYGIRKITSQKDGEVLYERLRGEEEEGYVLRGNVARMMNDLMTDTVAFGTGRGANFGRPAAGKTGTTQNSRDAWFIGFTPQYVAGVWVGNDDNSPTKKITGGSMPAHIWRDFMRVAHQGKPVMHIPQHFQYFDGKAMDGDLFNSSGPLPWQSGGRTGRPNKDLPWNRRDEQPRYTFPPAQNPRHQLHEGAPVSRDVQLPTSRVQPAPNGGLPAPDANTPFPSADRPVQQPPGQYQPPPEPWAAPKQEDEDSSLTEWIKDKISTGAEKREYDYPAGGRKRPLFD